ncbi:hypothetical protein A2982_01085 [candidate division WWE3 bacterium RIFCSPLOWO2_01_FULL_39_13]|uniref:PAS domain-containing protein n=1 Tax=candidate division WWE3 bacterium RIFCSPLOWO2_01_FULL_39_13 TaxID=1802624 RepID=A0A1F4V2Z8_UNCKA|nr:MAG: hypothetical protein A2982_01085 [candidate division WWE3 bacterium RIFCSPLOWO2_01_FULL_39_13]
MGEHEHHEQLIKGISKEYEDIFEGSKQGIYIYLDDNHKVCNQQLAKMLGYDSADDWVAVTEDLVGMMVAEGSQEKLINAFLSAHDKSIGSEVEVTWNKKTGGSLDTKVILVPISFQGHIFALHFVTPL